MSIEENDFLRKDKQFVQGAFKENLNGWEMDAYSFLKTTQKQKFDQLWTFVCTFCYLWQQFSTWTM